MECRVIRVRVRDRNYERRTNEKRTKNDGNYKKMLNVRSDCDNRGKEGDGEENKRKWENEKECERVIDGARGMGARNWKKSRAKNR